MIDSAQVMLEMMHEHPLGARASARWEAEGGFNVPHLVEALSRMLTRNRGTTMAGSGSRC